MLNYDKYMFLNKSHPSRLIISIYVACLQIEKNFRLDFFCKVQTKLDQEEIEKNDMMIELLLENILPKHVANHFTRRSDQATVHT